MSKRDQEIIRAASAYPMLMNIPEGQQEAEFRKTLTYIIAVCSIKEENLPSGQQVNVMLNYFRNHHRTMTMEELRLAADLNFAREDSEKVKHFQCIDIEFLTSLIARYRQDRMKAIIELKKITAVPEAKQLEAPKASLNSLIAWYEKNGSLPITYDWLAVFEEMREVKKCEPFEEMKKWMEPEEKNIRSEISMKLKTCTSLIEKRQIELSLEKDAIRMELRKRYVKKRIPELVNTEIK